MNTHDQSYFALTDILGIRDTKTLNAFLDTVLEKYNILDLTGFPMAPLQSSFTFEQTIKALQPNIMASYVSLQSDPIPIGTEGFSVNTGTIPRQKAMEVLDEIKTREIYMLANRTDISSDRLTDAAAYQLYVTLDMMFGGHHNSMTYQRHQIVSTGKFATTNANNPRGIQNFTFDAHVPSKNITALASTKQWWTDKGTYATEGTTSDPIGDLEAMVDAADDAGIAAKHFEIDKVYAKHIVKHSKVVKAIAANIYPMGDETMATAAVANLSFDRKIQVLGEIVGAPIRVQDHIATVQKWDNSTKALKNESMRSFASDVIVLVPDGNLGNTLAVEPLRLPGGIYGDRMNGALLLSIVYDYQRKIQTYNTELTALVVPDKTPYMFYLYPSGK